MHQIFDIIIGLVGSVIDKNYINRTTVLQLSDKETENVLILSKHHDIAHLVSYAIAVNKISLPDCEASKKLKKRHPIAVIRYEALNGAYEQMCEGLENGKIPFIPLKGSVIRDLYPEPWMRTSCDVDILVHEEDVEKAAEILVGKLGYERKSSGTHDVSFFSPAGVHVELHFTLSEVFYESSAEKILDNVWDYAYLKEGFKCQYLLKDEFYYFFHIYHMAKHFEKGGCGIRPFIDLWFLDNKVEYDLQKRNELLGSGELLKFADSCRELSSFWFGEGKKNELMNNMQKFIFSGGTYGTFANGKLVKNAKMDSGFKYIMGRIFMPYDKLKVQFPILKKHKWLLPFCEVARWFKLFRPKYRNVAKKDLNVAGSKKITNTDSMENFLTDIGLKQTK